MQEICCHCGCYLISLQTLNIIRDSSLIHNSIIRTGYSKSLHYSTDRQRIVIKKIGNLLNFFSTYVLNCHYEDVHLRRVRIVETRHRFMYRKAGLRVGELRFLRTNGRVWGERNIKPVVITSWMQLKHTRPRFVPSPQCLILIF